MPSVDSRLLISLGIGGGGMLYKPGGPAMGGTGGGPVAGGKGGGGSTP